jgi:hypothetical protein
VETYDHCDPDSLEPRAHPWSEAEADPRNQYYDLKENQALIRTSLEDFLPWAEWPAIDTFYELLEWINGAGSVLESNDCAFTGPGENESPRFAKALAVTGRFMILWRDSPFNLSKSNVEWLKGAVHSHLGRIDPEFHWGVVGLTVYPAKFVTLRLPGDQQFGFQLMVSFWSWGDSEAEVMANLDRTFRNVREALRDVVSEARDLL